MSQKVVISGLSGMLIFILSGMVFSCHDLVGNPLMVTLLVVKGLSTFSICRDRKGRVGRQATQGDW